MPCLRTAPYLIGPGSKLDLARRPTVDRETLDKAEAGRLQRSLGRRLSDLQELLYADGRRALLVVFQAMDAGGKDSTVRRVFGPVNPAGCRVTSFKAPSDRELGHDFLWRVHAEAPARGQIRVFNRSHYEDVLIARVKGLVPAARWRKRFAHIKAFERMLHDEGTAIVKFFLHISKDYQKQRLLRRLRKPEKHWKFDPGDLAERARWDDYQSAYSEAIARCSTAHAPWYVVPAERRWVRDLVVTQVLVETLESMGLRYPEPTFDPEAIEVV